MAAWLAYLKSRLLLPEPPTPDGPSAEDMANALANRLRRLEAIREAANQLMNRPQLQRDIFPRGDPEPIADIKHPQCTATLYDLLTAYAAQRQQRVLATVHLAKRTVWSLAEARASLERLVGMAERLEPPRRISCCNYLVDPSQRATVLASSFAATLELVREGAMEVHQKEAFAPIYLRKRPPQASGAMSAPDAAGRVSEEGDRAMASLAEKRMDRCRGRSDRPECRAEARPEELRLLEALLFASAEPLDQTTLAKRLPEGVDVKAALRAAAGRIRPARRQSGARRQQMDLPHRRRSVVAADARKRRRRGSCRAPRSRCSRSSPITSR